MAARPTGGSPPRRPVNIAPRLGAGEGGAMADKQGQTQCSAIPDAATIAERGQEILSALSAARSKLDRAVEDIASDHRRIEQDRAELADQWTALDGARTEFGEEKATEEEALHRRRRALDEQSAESADRKSALAAETERLSEQAEQQQRACDSITERTAEMQRQLEAVALREAELKSTHELLAEERERVTAGIEELGRQRASVETLARQVEEEKAQGVAANEATAAEHQRMVARSEQETADLKRRTKLIEEHEGRAEQAHMEIESTRQVLAAMQARLTREQQELATQRGELLEQIGGLPTRIGPSNGKAVAGAPADLTQSESTSAPSRPPKPAGGSTTSQFRKLRRDAKRRAIGA